MARQRPGVLVWSIVGVAAAGVAAYALLTDAYQPPPPATAGTGAPTGVTGAVRSTGATGAAPGSLPAAQPDAGGGVDPSHAPAPIDAYATAKLGDWQTYEVRIATAQAIELSR